MAEEEPSQVPAEANGPVGTLDKFKLAKCEPR